MCVGPGRRLAGAVHEECQRLVPEPACLVARRAERGGRRTRGRVLGRDSRGRRARRVREQGRHGVPPERGVLGSIRRRRRERRRAQRPRAHDRRSPRGRVHRRQDLGVPELLRRRHPDGADARRVGTVRTHAPSYRLDVEDVPDPADLALLEERVAAAAIAAAGVGDDYVFAMLVRDGDGRIRAGISGTVWGGYCELQAMWVAESLRGRGVARTLMAAAEAEASRRGCARVVFHAYDLLAPAFYERFGYETVAVIEGCPEGSAARWYRKELTR